MRDPLARLRYACRDDEASRQYKQDKAQLKREHEARLEAERARRETAGASGSLIAFKIRDNIRRAMIGSTPDYTRQVAEKTRQKRLEQRHAWLKNQPLADTDRRGPERTLSSFALGGSETQRLSSTSQIGDFRAKTRLSCCKDEEFVSEMKLSPRTSGYQQSSFCSSRAQETHAKLAVMSTGSSAVSRMSKRIVPFQ
jgi:hypothetical protein